MRQHHAAIGYMTGAAILIALVVLYPPGPFTWTGFYFDQAGWLRKIELLAEFYLWPAMLSFGSIVLFQIQMRMSMLGARSGVVFPVCVLASVAMVAAWRTLGHGLASVPGYALGLASAYSLMSNVYALRPSRRTLAGVRWPVIVWRGNSAEVQNIQRTMAARHSEKFKAA